MHRYIYTVHTNISISSICCVFVCPLERQRDETALIKCAIRGNCSSSAVSSECCLSPAHAALLTMKIWNTEDMTQQHDGDYFHWGWSDVSALQVDSKFLVGLGGILVVGCSVLSSMGFYSWIGVPSSLVILQVVPFLVLAVGADNIFIFVLEYQVRGCLCERHRLAGGRSVLTVVLPLSHRETCAGPGKQGRSTLAASWAASHPACSCAASRSPSASF